MDNLSLDRIATKLYWPDDVPIGPLPGRDFDGRLKTGQSIREIGFTWRKRLINL